MKKRFLPILLATTIAALSLSACASISVDPTYAYIEKSYEELFDELNENFDSETYSCTYLWNYPRDVECLVKKCIYANDETWSKNYTHFVAPNGDEMNFIWDGPDSLGTKAWSGESTLGLAEAEKIYRLYAWSNPLETMDGALKNYDNLSI